MAVHKAYQGPDRRLHKVFITKHSEYHIRRNEVVAVRPRGSKEWLTDHTALAMTLVGRINPGSLLPQSGSPRPGQRMYLAHGDNDVVTSAVVAIVRPPKQTVSAYPELPAYPKQHAHTFRFRRTIRYHFQLSEKIGECTIFYRITSAWPCLQQSECDSVSVNIPHSSRNYPSAKSGESFGFG
jgi:hypothetical protein